ncbi:hypothetical protein KAT51_04190 [bacterium]|nr:hypothetical protein [bacterium]
MLKELTEFEAFCWHWFNSHYNQFSVDMNLMSEFIKELNFEKEDRHLFLKSVNMIYLTTLKIQNEIAEKEAKRKRA